MNEILVAIKRRRCDHTAADQEVRGRPHRKQSAGAIGNVNKKKSENRIRGEKKLRVIKSKKHVLPLTGWLSRQESYEN